MSEMKRMLLPIKHPLHPVSAIMILGPNIPSFTLFLHIHSVSQLEMFVASAEKDNISAFLLVHLLKFIIK